jgi:hypothetical protein
VRHTGAVRTGVALGVAAVLAAVLVGGGVLARVAATWPVTGPAPLHSAPAVPASGAGRAVVELSADARAHPAGEAVRAQLQRYFDAINARSYAAWMLTVVPRRVQEQPEQVWLAGIDTSTDGTIRLDRVDDLDGSRVLARVRFVSTQDLSDAPAAVPARRICWRASLPMSGTPPLVESGRPDNVVAEAC